MMLVLLSRRLYWTSPRILDTATIIDKLGPVRPPANRIARCPMRALPRFQLVHRLKPESFTYTNSSSSPFLSLTPVLLASVISWPSSALWIHIHVTLLAILVPFHCLAAAECLLGDAPPTGANIAAFFHRVSVVYLYLGNGPPIPRHADIFGWRTEQFHVVLSKRLQLRAYNDPESDYYGQFFLCRAPILHLFF